MFGILIRNARILQVSSKRDVKILAGHDIGIEGNLIKAIEPCGTISHDSCKEIIDAQGMIAVPGLINTHSHVPMVIFRGLAEDVSLEKWFNEYMWPLESNLVEEDVYWGMLLGIIEMIECGVTTVADHYFYMDQAAKAVEESGIRAALGWAVFGNQGEKMLDRTARFIECWQNKACGRITTWMAPHAPYTCDDSFLRAVAKKACDLNVGIHIHVAETMEQTNASIKKRGITPIAILEETGILDRYAILAHAIGTTPSDIEILKRHRAGIAHSPKTYLKLAMGTAPVVEFLKAGIPVGLATDGAVSNNTLDIWESMRLMAMTQKQARESPEAMKIPDVLYIATRGSANVINMESNIGAIECGYLADIILVDMTGAHVQPLHSVTASLVYASRPSDVQTVIVDGKIIMRDRRLLTIDKTEVINHVKKSMQRLASRVPDKRIQVYNP